MSLLVLLGQATTLVDTGYGIAAADIIQSIAESLEPTEPLPPDAWKSVMLYPALGCPALIDPQDMRLHLVLVLKPDEDVISDDSQASREEIRPLLRHIEVMPWDTALTPYRQDYDPDDLDDQTPWAYNRAGHDFPSLFDLLDDDADSLVVHYDSVQSDLSSYRENLREHPRGGGPLWYTMPDIVPQAFTDRGYTRIYPITVKLRSGVLNECELYTLYQQREDAVLDSILHDPVLFEKPYDDIPVMKKDQMDDVGGATQAYFWRKDRNANRSVNRVGDREREHRVRWFHPFVIVREEAREYLNLGHVTDLHVGTLWDFFEQQLFPDFDSDQPQIDPTAFTRENQGNLVSEHFNNPNLNVRNLTFKLNQLTGSNYIDAILQTGDLVDFNRMFNMNPDGHDPDVDYIYNLAWIRYYELLLMDYRRPTFTSLGNHDWLLNPYPPRIAIEAENTGLVLLLGTCVGLTAFVHGLIVGAVGEAFSAEEDEVYGALINFLLVPFVWPVLLHSFLAILVSIAIGASEAGELFTNGSVFLKVLPFGLLAGFILALLYYIFIQGVMGGLTTERGMAAGGITGGTLLLASLFLYLVEIGYMDGIVNLLSDEFDDVLSENTNYLNAFGRDGVLFTTEQATRWYSLVVNPFSDYVLQHGNSYVMMANWEKTPELGEMLTLDPPQASDVFTDRQWELIETAVELARALRDNRAGDSHPIRIVFGLHTPIFCPRLDTQLTALYDNGGDADDSNIERGIMEERRGDLVLNFFRLERDMVMPRILPVSLAGHTHVYDVFHVYHRDEGTWAYVGDPPTFDDDDAETAHEELIREADFDDLKVRWSQSMPGADQPMPPGCLSNTGLHITTACAGPPADGIIPELDAPALRTLLAQYEQEHDSSYDHDDNDAKYKTGQRVPRFAGCRYLVFNPDGSIQAIHELSSDLSRAGKVSR